MIDLYNQRKADGILISIIKFCEEEEFDYPVLKKDFEAEGIPVLYLETLRIRVALTNKQQHVYRRS